MNFSTLRERYESLDPWMRAIAQAQARVTAFVATYIVLAVWHTDNIWWAVTYYLGLLGLWLHGDFNGEQRA